MVARKFDPKYMVWSDLGQKEFPNFFDATLWIPDALDAVQVIGWAVFFTLARLYIQSYFLKVAKRLDVEEATKFSESCWKVVFYSVTLVYGLILVYRSEFFVGKILLFPFAELKIYYLYQLGFYFHCLYAHFAYEVKRSDFWPLLFHHVVTIWLIYFSYVIGFHRIGLLVLICHDPNDVLFEIGKTFVYRKMERMTHITFVLIMVSWVCTRLLLYPFKVLWSTAIQSLLEIPWDAFPFYYMFNGCLSFLLCLHIYWFFLMLRMLYRVLTGKEKGVVDSREKDKTDWTKKPTNKADQNKSN